MNHYEILEISIRASPEVIRAAYKSLIQRYHPDRNPNDKFSIEKSKSITVAYEVLSNPAARARYDAQFSRDNDSTRTSGQTDKQGDKTTVTPRENAARTSNTNAKKEAQSSTFITWLLVGAAGIGAIWLGNRLDKADRGRREQAYQIQIEEAQRQKDLADFTAQQRANTELEKKREVARLAAESLKRRTIQPLPLNFVSEIANPAYYSGDSTGYKFIEIPQVEIVIGESRTKDVLYSVSQNTIVIQAELRKNLRELKGINLVGLNGESTVKRVMLRTFNRVLLGERSEEANCETWYRLADGKIVAPSIIFGGDIQQGNPEQFCFGVTEIRLPRSFLLR